AAAREASNVGDEGFRRQTGGYGRANTPAPGSGVRPPPLGRAVYRGAARPNLARLLGCVSGDALFLRRHVWIGREGVGFPPRQTPPPPAASRPHTTGSSVQIAGKTARMRSHAGVRGHRLRPAPTPPKLEPPVQN